MVPAAAPGFPFVRGQIATKQGGLATTFVFGFFGLQT